MFAQMPDPVPPTNPTPIQDPMPGDVPPMEVPPDSDPAPVPPPIRMA